MFFPQKIQSIRKGDRVLEIGPGSSPHPRSNEFLELKYGDDLERLAQRGHTQPEPSLAGRVLHYYDGVRFPFKDGQFDYVICSHVVEHVPDPIAFVSEICRVGNGRGYLEYPLVTYEYLYDFDVHRSFVKYDPRLRVLRFLLKTDTSLATFSPVTAALRASLERGGDDLPARCPEFFFEGFEFLQPFIAERARNIADVVPSAQFVRPRSLALKLVSKLGR